MLLARYRLERVVGRGGMGVVWAARDLESAEPRAIKLVHAKKAADLASHERLLREASAASSVRHPNVARVFEVLELPDGRPFIVMELLEGESLGARIRRRGRLSVGETARVLGEVSSAVMAAHRAGIIHRDLKPDNVFLTSSGVTKVLDFGVAKRLSHDDGEASLTTTGGIIGTPHYMAPEQIFGDEIDGRADVWALGILLHECLTGRRPTQGNGLGQILKIITTGSIPSLEQAPEDVGELAERMLRRKPSERPSLEEICEVLAKHATNEVAETPSPETSSPTLDTGEVRIPESLAGSTSRKTRARRPRAARAGLVVLGLAVIATVGARLLVRPAAPLPHSSLAPNTSAIVSFEEPLQTASAQPPPPPLVSIPTVKRVDAELKSARDAGVIDASGAAVVVAPPLAAAQRAGDDAAVRDASAESGFDLPLSAVRY